MPKKAPLSLRILEKLAPHANISFAGIDNFAVRAYNNKCYISNDSLYGGNRHITFVILNDEVILLPPKSKISKEDIVSAGVDLVRRSGEKGLNARNLAAALGCSTQPIFTNFPSMEELRKSVICKASELYYACLERECAAANYPPYKAMGMGYIKFAAEERELFRLLFMRDRSGEEKSDGETEDVKKSVELIMKGTGLGMNDAFMLHLELWIFVHGIASMIATSYLNWESELVSRMVSDAYEGIKARFISKDGKEDKNVR